MTLKMLLRWKNPDASTDINLRLKDVAAKGFLPFAPSVPFVPPALGAEIVPVPLVLQVTVSPFVLINYDGAVVTSDTISAPLTVADGQINYIVCRARYVLMGSPILQMQVLTQAAYLADPELPWLHVAGVVNLSVGGPYTSVPTSRIFYEARDAVDEQTRSSWREPVANSGLLPVPPADHNRHGDVRLVTSTGSLFWWNDTASLWEVFDEVPLITHRDLEHTNGITGDSAPGTLLPGVSGAGPAQNLTVAAVPVGSAYTVDGRLLQIPAAPLAILASSVGASRGLIRVEMDFLGNATASYRASSGTNNIDYALIVNMSDAHPAGIFTLNFVQLAGTLQWDNGPPVVVPVAPSGTRRYRLFRPNGTDWIEIVVNNLPAAPGINTSDNYTVTAPTDFETNLLVGLWFWDGTGGKPLIVGQDKRRFGNLAFPQMSTDFKEVEFNPPEAELRGNMVYSGGTCTSLGGFILRITGPIISYIQGKRFVTPAFFTGTAFPASSTRFVYVDEAGALQIQVQDPATVFDANGRPLQVAEVARIITDGVTFTTIEDRRDPQIIVGNATRDSRVRFTGAASARWNDANTRLVVENAGATTGVSVETGSLRTTDNLVVATSGALTWDDTNTATPQALTAVGEGDVSVLQPGNATPSVLGTLRDIQRAKKFGVGVETGCAPSIGVGASVDIASGTFYDALGRRIGLSAPINVVISAPLANNVYAVVWDPDLTASGSFKTVNLTAGSGGEIQDLPFAVAVLNGAANAITTLENVVRTADGQYDRSFVTVSGVAAFDEANFNSLRKALLHIMCFAGTEPGPKEVRVVGNLTETNTVAEGACITFTNAVGFAWAQPSRFSGVKVVGRSNANASPASRPTITWTSTSGPLINFNATTSDIRGFGFQNVNFAATGTASITDHNRCLFKNISRGFSCLDATIDGNNILSHFVYWTDSVVELGGGVGAVSQSAGVLFQRVFGTQCVDNGGDAIFFFGDNTGTGAAQVTDINGRLTILDCVFECDATDIADYFISTDTELDTDTGEFDVVIDKTTLSRFQRVFLNCDEAQKLITASTLSDISLGISNGATRQAQITGTVFSGTSVVLTGAGDVVGCSLASTCTLNIATTNRITSCDFSLGTVLGNIGSISNSIINLGITGLLSAPTSSSSAWPSITNSTILKANDNANSNTMLSLASSARCVVTSSQFVYTNIGITSTQPVISLTSTTAQLFLKDCTINVTGLRSLMTAAITVTSSAGFRLAIEACRFDVPLNFLSVARAAASSTGEVHLNNNTVFSAGTAPIDVQNSTSGQMNVLQMKGNSFTFTGVSPVVNLFHVKDMTVSNNSFYHTNGDASYTFGGTTATEGRQDNCLVQGNTFKGDTSAAKCDISGDSYKNFVLTNNTQSVINVAGAIATTYVQIAGQSAWSKTCTVSGNTLVCDHNGIAGTIADALILVNAFQTITVSGNTSTVQSAGGDISSSLLLTTLSELTCTGNTCFGYQSVGATTGLCNASINAEGPSAGNGHLVVSSNVLEASVGGSGTGGCTTQIVAQNAQAAVVADNVLRNAGGGATANCDITVGGSLHATISANILRASQDCRITDASSIQSANVTGNTLWGNAGDARIELDTITIDGAATGNILVASDVASLVIGDGVITRQAVVTGNTIDASDAVQGVLLRALAIRTAAVTGNSVRAVASIQMNAGSTTAANAIVSGNVAYAGDSVTAQAAAVLNASVVGNSLNSDTSDATASAIMHANSANGICADNLLDAAAGVANLICSSVGARTLLMGSISDNVCRSGGSIFCYMGGTSYSRAKVRDNIGNNAFDTIGVIGTALIGGNNLA